jgi:protein TonB
MTAEERGLLYRSFGASLVLHLLSAVFLWRTQIPAPYLPDPSPLMVRLLPPNEIPRFIDQEDLPGTNKPVKSKDISQITSEARSPGRVPGVASTPESSGTPKAGPLSPPPGAGKLAEVPASPPVPGQPPPPRAPTSEPARESQRLARPDSSPSPPTPPRPSLREEIARLGTQGSSVGGKGVDAGELGDTGTGERIVSLETQSSEYGSYLADVKRRIERHWEIPPYARQTGLTGKLVVVFSITADGDVAHLEISESSGTSVLDEAAVQAVRAAAPYGRFPPHFTFRRLTIVGNFRYADLTKRVKPSH